MIGEPKNIDPESPIRLRECLTALANHSGLHVLRVEVGLGPSTHQDGTSLHLVLTHSLGPKHELAMAPTLAKVFAETLSALALNVAGQSEGDPR